MFNDEAAHRKVIFEAWRKHKAKEDLSTLEKQLVAILMQHPEFHHIFEHPEEFLNKHFNPETDGQHPILHVAMHQAIADQVTMNHPEGITEIYNQLVKTLGDFHVAEHCIAHHLTHHIYNALHGSETFNTEQYLHDLRQIIIKGRWEMN